MQHAHIDISRGLDGESVVLACFDLREDEVAAAARAVAATAAERYRTPRISADDVLELRELTALTDELEHGSRLSDPAHGRDAGHINEPGAEHGRGVDPGHAEHGRGVDPGGGRAAEPGRAVEPGQGIRRLVFKPARLSVLRDAVAAFVESRDEAEWIREEDREPLALLRGMLLPLEQLCADALRAALSPESHVG
ncbi:MAG TPA: hypothetical protein VG126_02605 [Thermoleophilaceae bacterium]|nr:hypothetical protein [Thermoleophilaceae bacterium]